MKNSFNALSTFLVKDKKYRIFRLDALERKGWDISKLPFSLRVLLENLLRCEDGVTVTKDDIAALAIQKSNPNAKHREISYSPARVLLQDFTGVPAIVDLAAMRDAIVELGGDPDKINPRQPVELVIDHSIQVDRFGSKDAFEHNIDLDYKRNYERYAFLRWGQSAFNNFKVVPPNGGIVHQINLEYLARVVFSTAEIDTESDEAPLVYPDTCVGTDSHTPMVNGLGVLAWGVGGIEAEAAMLGQPISMLVPEVVGFRLQGHLPEGSTATDLVLTVTEMLRKKGVVGKFVEFYGPGIASLSLADRATISNMAPEYGATCAIFPPDDVTIQYLRFTGRSDEHVALVEAYMREQGLFHTADSPDPLFADTLTLDLNKVEPSIAGPKRPQDRIPLSQVKTAFKKALPELQPTGRAEDKAQPNSANHITDGSVVIAAITSCTNTSNPAVMIAAGLLAKKAVENGLSSKPWVKTSLAPGSRVVTRYFDKAGLTPYLNKLGFNLAGYGCTTCIGNSGPLPKEITRQIHERGLVAASVLSGNRNFEGRINPEVRANYLMSPPLVVAFALAGRADWDPYNEPLGIGKDGRQIFLKDLWPNRQEIDETINTALRSDMFHLTYESIYDGDERWTSMDTPSGSQFNWSDESTYIRQPPYFKGITKKAPEVATDILGVRTVALLGDSITTDHISPAGSILHDSPAGQFLIDCGVPPEAYNSYGSRRGNHEVMVRGTFANVRIRNRLVPEKEGGYTSYLPTNETMTIYDAAVRYQQDGIPLCVIAGKEYGSGSSRDWAAKGASLQGIKFVLAQSYERIHRSNLVGMGILPLEFLDGESADTLNITGHETFDVIGVDEALSRNANDQRYVTIRATDDDKSVKEFRAIVRIDTPQELRYYLHGGILHFVLRDMIGGDTNSRPAAGGTATTAQPRPGSNPSDTAVDLGSLGSFPASDSPAY